MFLLLIGLFSLGQFKYFSDPSSRAIRVLADRVPLVKPAPLKLLTGFYCVGRVRQGRVPYILSVLLHVENTLVNAFLPDKLLMGAQLGDPAPVQH